MMDQTAAAAPEGRTIRVRGLVQGVGFRPAVWRLARECGLSGAVWNDAEGVMMRAWGGAVALDRFLVRLRDEAPPLARVDAVEWAAAVGAPECAGFRIVPSRGGEVHTGVVPDAATCSDCLAEMRDPGDRRWRYPFTNCTHCGPRLSIVRAVPYDRANTSMAAFTLCPACRAEYEDPHDRRFHAQPTACPACGPRAWLECLRDGPGRVTATGHEVVEAARAILRDGGILAVKGLGGFHLACDALNDDTVAVLRARKRRYAKPLALMAASLDVMHRYCALGAEEAALLASAAAPIVILPATGPERVADSVAPGQGTLGFMLPSTPLHHLLLEGLDGPLVMTSGNLSEEPQCTGNDEARARLSAIADAGLFHDREIVNRLDDSVVRVAAGAPRLLRRARGYAPAPLRLPEGFADAPPLLGMGGELKSTFCLLHDGQAILSQHIGDLEDAAAIEDYQKTLGLYVDLFDHRAEALAVDMHPEYLSTKLGREQAAEAGCGIEAVQHHHAHIASCLAENGVPLDTGPVLGVALDGLGFGPDGTLWGGEVLRADYLGYERLARLPPVAMPGGAQAVRQPWRSLWAHLEAALGWERVRRAHGSLELVRFLEAKPVATLAAMTAKGLNSPLSSSCGRLFDALAAALGVCRERVSYEGQAAVELENLAAPCAPPERGYPIPVRRRADVTAPGGLPTLDLGPMWRAILADLGAGAPAGVVAARFHRGLAEAIVALVRVLAERDAGPHTRTVALSGGAFQNALLLEAVTRGLEADGLTVLSHREVPANDGGLALGQAAVAAARRIQGQHGLPGEATSCA